MINTILIILTFFIVIMVLDYCTNNIVVKSIVLTLGLIGVIMIGLYQIDIVENIVRLLW
jgi:hypothetical protein